MGEHKLELGRLTSAVHSSSVEEGLLAQLFANQLIGPPGHCKGQLFLLSTLVSDYIHG